MTCPEPIRVVVRHQSPVLQAGLMAMLARFDDIACTASEGAIPIYAGATRPDVIITDHCSALQWLDSLGSVFDPRPRPRVLVVAQTDRESDIRAALSAGVQGYLLMDDSADQLVAAVRADRPERRILSPRVASRLAESMAGESLTQRELVVLALVVDGFCNKSIANRLGITSGTVKSHLRSAFGKLGVGSRTQAVAMAQRRGLIQHPGVSGHEAYAPAFSHA
jgi:DNA-binding NarL/FixJ family response regulator